MIRNVPRVADGDSFERVEPPADRPQRLVVMGTGAFAVPMLEALLASPHEVVAVVTRPDRTAAGRRPPPNPVRDAALTAGLPVLAPESVNADTFVTMLRSLRADFLVVCDYGQILSAIALSTARLGGLNLHGSLLPRHRGAAPVQWAILEGDHQTGVSVIRMTPALDAGRVIESYATPIGSRETAAELEPRLAILGAPLVLRAIERLAASAEPDSLGVTQDPSSVTRAPRLAKVDAVVDWSLTAESIDRRRRAFEPWPRICTFLPTADGRAQSPRIGADAGATVSGVTGVRLTLLETVSVEWPLGRGSEIPGTILAANEAGLVVGCGGGTALAITRVVPEGRREMTAADFIRGTLVLPGMRLTGRS